MCDRNQYGRRWTSECRWTKICRSANGRRPIDTSLSAQPRIGTRQVRTAAPGSCIAGPNADRACSFGESWTASTKPLSTWIQNQSSYLNWTNVRATRMFGIRSWLATTGHCMGAGRGSRGWTSGTGRAGPRCSTVWGATERQGRRRGHNRVREAPWSPRFPSIEDAPPSLEWAWLGSWQTHAERLEISL